MAACKWMDTGFAEAEVLVREGAGTEKLRAPGLFAMVCLLNSKGSEDIDYARSRFEQRTSWKQKQAKDALKATG